MFCCKGEEYPTPWGPLKDAELKNANVLYLYFYDMVNDGGEYAVSKLHAADRNLKVDDEDNYRDARNLFADPLTYLREKQAAERATQLYAIDDSDDSQDDVERAGAIDDGELMAGEEADANASLQKVALANEKEEKERLKKLEKDVQKARDKGAKEAEINAIYARYEAEKKKAQQEVQMAELQKVVDKEEAEAIKAQLKDLGTGSADKNDSTFSASFYGPLFDEQEVEKEPSFHPPESSTTTEPEPDLEHRYFWVHETHKGVYEDSVAAKRIRYYILTVTDPRGRLCLHVAAKHGDKHFGTMIVKEAEYYNFLHEIIDFKDNDGLTPLYMLAETGYQKSNLNLSEDEQALENLARAQLDDEVNIMKKNDGLVEDENGVEPEELQQQKQDVAAELARIGDILAEYSPEELEVRQGKRYSVWIRLPDLTDEECTKPSRCYLTQLFIQSGADPNIQSSEVKHTPLHWLAYWGDHRAVHVVLKLNRYDHIMPPSSRITREEYIAEQGAFNMFMTSNDQTPADIAGDMQNNRCLREMVNHFSEKDHDEIISAYATQSIRKKFGAQRFSQLESQRIKFTNSDTKLRNRITLTWLSSNDFNKQQRAYLRLAYWSISMANIDAKIEQYMKKFVYLFILDLGISPFIKCYRNKTLIHACVVSNRADFMRELLSHHYECYDVKDWETFAKSCKSKDYRGDNVLHEVFQKPVEARNKFLEIICDEKYYVNIYLRPQEPGCCTSSKVKSLSQDEPCERVQIGDFNKRNRLSFKPVDFEHDQPIIVTERLAQISEEVQRELIDSLEADYLIKTMEDYPGDQRPKLIENQLKDLNFRKGKEYFMFVEEKEPGCCQKKSQEQEYWIYIAIKFPMETINMVATKSNVFGDLDVSNIRLPFDASMKKHFTMFDARQRYLCIQNMLRSELDFDRFVEIGVIAEHYPLHRLSLHDDISDSLLKYLPKLTRRLICGGWFRYSQPIHLIKKYYGERFSFYFMFFLTYQSWLLLPAFFGLAIFGYQMELYRQKGNMIQALDTYWNNLLGIGLAIWASLFVESWISKSDKLKFMWDMDTPADYLGNDEREGQFTYQNEYNPDVNFKMKKQTGNQTLVKFLNLIVTIIMMGMTAGTMIFFENRTSDDISTVDASTIVSQYSQDFMDPTSIAYGFVLMVIGNIYEWITDKFLDAMNYRYRKDYNDARAKRLFFFNCLNNFLPLLYVAFFRDKTGDNKPFLALFSMLFIVFVIDQLKEAFIRLCKPIFMCYRRDIDKLHASYEDKFKLKPHKMNNPRHLMRKKIEYQIRVNDAQMDADNDTGEETMALVMQFGYVCLFSNVFPMAAFFAYISNMLTMKSIMQEFQIKKRTMPEISLGIGIYASMLDLLSQAAVCINVALCYYNSEATSNLVIKEWSNNKLSALQYFMIVVGVEHFIYILKMAIRMLAQAETDENLDKMRINELHIFGYERLKVLKQKRIQEKKKEEEFARRLQEYKKTLINFETQSEKERREAEEAEKIAAMEREEALKQQIASQLVVNDEVLHEKRRLIRLAEQKRLLQKKHTGLKNLAQRSRKIHDGLEMEYVVFPDDLKDRVYLENPDLVDHFDENIKNKKAKTQVTRLPVAISKGTGIKHWEEIENEELASGNRSVGDCCDEDAKAAEEAELILSPLKKRVSKQSA